MKGRALSPLHTSCFFRDARRRHRARIHHGTRPAVAHPAAHRCPGAGSSRRKVRHDNLTLPPPSTRSCLFIFSSLALSPSASPPQACPARPASPSRHPPGRRPRHDRPGDRGRGRHPPRRRRALARPACHARRRQFRADGPPRGERLWQAPHPAERFRQDAERAAGVFVCGEGGGEWRRRGCGLSEPLPFFLDHSRADAA